ncbi:MAG: HAD family hydrolase [Lapillicoccus sp.]
MLLVFDINETLLDLAPMDDVLGGSDRRRDWFGLVIRTAMVSAATGDYRDFAELGGAAGRALGLDDDAVATLAATMRALPSHPDVRPGLIALRDAGHRLVALGNSPLRVLEPQLAHADLDAMLHATYSAEQAGALKPNPAPYLFVLDAEHVEPAEATMVAAHDWDVAGAVAVGMRGALITRKGTERPLPLQPDPDYTVATIEELANRLG